MWVLDPFQLFFIFIICFHACFSRRYVISGNLTPAFTLMGMWRNFCSGVQPYIEYNEFGWEFNYTIQP